MFGNVSSVNKVTNGKTVTENVITGSEYTIAENPVVANKTVVGWNYNGAFMFAGETIPLSDDITIEAVFVAFAVEKGAEITRFWRRLRWMLIRTENQSVQTNTSIM